MREYGSWGGNGSDLSICKGQFQWFYMTGKAQYSIFGKYRRLFWICMRSSFSICDSITSVLSCVQNIYDPESQVCDATNIGDPGSERIYVCDTVLQPYGMSRVCVTNISTSICDIISVYAIRQQEVLNRRLKQYRIYRQSISKIFLLSNIATFGVSLCHLECI